MWIPLENYDKILETHSHLKKLYQNHWMTAEFLTFQWWIMLFLMVASWTIWWKLLDRTRTAYIVIYGFMVLLSATGMDAFGVHYQFWIYPIRFTVAIPHVTPINWGILPIVYMLIYQYYPQWKSFIKANIVMSAIFSFLGEPLVEWLGIYYVLHWKHIWSFPIYIFIAIVSKWLTESLLALKPRKQKK